MGRPMTRKMRCGIHCWTMMLCVFILSCGSSKHPATRPTQQLNLFIWASYIDPTVLEQFEKETGVAVRVVTYPSQEILLTVLLAGHTQYDVVDVSSEQLKYLAGNGVFQQLDRDQLKNWNNLDEAVLDQLSQVDPGNHFAVPYLWGTTGMAINVTKIKQVAPAVPLDSWSLLLDPANVAQVAKCGVFFTDAPNDITSTVLLYLGKDPNSSAPSDLAQAAERLMNVRRSVTRIDADGQINDLTSGEICAELAWTPVLVQARRRTKEVGGQSELRFVIPREGAMSFIDALAVPQDAPHSKEAHQFLDFLMRGDIAARNATFTGGASPNRAAFDLLDPAVRNDTAIYPPEAVIKTLHPVQMRSPDESRIVTRNWTRFRTGY
jgi:putrescine transport system substrate-binding protein